MYEKSPGGAPHPRIIREVFLEERVPKLGPLVGRIPVVRKHEAWPLRFVKWLTLLNLDFKVGSRES